MISEHDQFDQEMTPEDHRIDDLLKSAMEVVPPAGLASRVAQASIPSTVTTGDQQFEQQLNDALIITSPEGLVSRVFDASVDALQSDPPLVLARIDTRVLWRQVALAACLACAALVAIQFSAQPIQVDRSMLAHNVLSVDEEELLLEDLNLSDYTYLADTRELAFADIAESMSSLRNDIELWQYGLLTE